MKKLNKYCSGLFLTLVTLATAPFELHADNKNGQDLIDLSYIEMINSVPLGKASELVQKFQMKEAQNRLLNGKYNPKGECSVETMRNKEVIVITIPAHLLFGPNSTELSDKAGDYLSPLRRYVKGNDTYRVLLLMHTDNTGSEKYREELTMNRVDAIYEWFEDEGLDTHFLFPYALGDENPLVENNSMENRDKNRRLEVYLVPGEGMLEQAKKGRIAF